VLTHTFSTDSENVDHIVFQILNKCSFLNLSFFTNIHIFNYPGPWLSGLFRPVPLSPDYRSSTVPETASIPDLEYRSPAGSRISAV